MSRPNALIYCRISEDRAGAGLGVQRQEADCRELADRLGWDVAEVLVDNDVSAYSGKRREGYQRMLDALANDEANAVLAWHNDRLHRSPAELESFISLVEAKGCRVAVVQGGEYDLTTPTGRMTARIIGAVARGEIEHSIDRMRTARLQAINKGKWTGGRRSFGFESDGITHRDDEAEVIRQASAEIIAGVSLRSIAKRLNDQGVRTACSRRKHEDAEGNPCPGHQWRPTELRRALLRPRNAGLIVHHGQVVPGVPAEWEPIVDEDTWRAVVAVMSDDRRRTSRGAPIRYLGSGLFRCGVCDDGTTVHSGSSNERRGYSCRRARHLVRAAEPIEEFIAELVIERLSRDDAAELMVPPAPDTSAMHTEAAGLRGRLDELADLYADGSIDARQLARGTDELRIRLADVEERIGEAAAGTALGQFAGRDPREVWEALDLDRRRAVVDALMVVTLHTARKGRTPGWRPGEPYFDPDSIDVQWRTG